MNKRISLLLCLTLLLGLTACGTQKPSEAAPQQAVIREEEPAAETEDDEFNLDDVKEESQDFSKYEEVKDQYNTAPVPEGKQEPVEPGDVPIDKKDKRTCYLTISCKTILNNMDKLEEGKEVLVPKDGMILSKTKVEYYSGESVFDVLQRETRKRRIHMESSFTPVYNSAYIEGIGNLYEFDCGSASGWQYSVNGWFPNYGVSRYAVRDGDNIVFHYTCDLGRDLSGE